MSGRAAYVSSGGNPNIQDAGDVAAATREISIQFPSLFVTGGDTDSSVFASYDADKDHYSNNLMGSGFNGTPPTTRPYDSRRHLGGQNILFADGHVKKMVRFDPQSLTFRYDTMSGW